ncbi:MAG: 50S ribosomal protein L16 [archaeon]|nr:50S ribosomal protein L16 [archaeon]
MGIRKALAYSKRKFTSYTRKSTRVKSKNYIKAVPNQKVTKFNMGNIRKLNKGEFKHVITIYSMMNVQIRDLALEATRQMLNNRLGKMLMDNYSLLCKPYPHQVIRENKTFSGGSKGERVQSGMAHSFGTTMYRSAVVKAGSPIFIIYYPDKKYTDAIRKVVKSAIPKLPCKSKVIYEEIK